MNTMWFQIWTADAGWFPEFVEMGWFVGTREQASQLLGFLLAAGLGASKVFMVADEGGMPIFPASTTPSAPSGLPGGGQVPGLPGTQPGATPWWDLLTY